MYLGRIGYAAIVPSWIVGPTEADIQAILNQIHPLIWFAENEAEMIRREAQLAALEDNMQLGFVPVTTDPYIGPAPDADIYMQDAPPTFSVDVLEPGEKSSWFLWIVFGVFLYLGLKGKKKP